MPQAFRNARSMVAASATPDSTRCTASRYMAYPRRLTIKPGTSFATMQGSLPTAFAREVARSIAASEVCCPRIEFEKARSIGRLGPVHAQKTFGMPPTFLQGGNGQRRRVARDWDLRGHNSFDFVKHMPLDAQILHYALDYERALREIGKRMRSLKTFRPRRGDRFRQAGTLCHFIHRGRYVRSCSLVRIGTGVEADYFKSVRRAKRQRFLARDKAKTGIRRVLIPYSM